MPIKTKIAATSTAVLRLLLKINTSLGNSLASGVEALDKATQATQATQSSKQVAAKEVEQQPTFVNTVLGFAKTIYMRPSRVVNEAALSLAHERWSEQFVLYLESNTNSEFSSQNYTFAEPCELCDWLAQDGRVRWGKNPVFSTLAERHKYFHEQADLVVALSKEGKHAKAQRVLDSSYRYGSNQTLLLLKKLKSLQKGQESI
jgi:hypothetical protein